ncbi:MMPL family transporter, partial [Plantactinospora mayteni]|uniref:MMPL family transporter n=1 Tax=Plantactinospora mayteni TaxID=566021 RepID=UPI0031ED83B0
PGAASAGMTGEDGSTLLTVVPTQRAMAGDVPGLVADLRQVPAPVATEIGGYPAETSDFRSELLSRVPLLALLVLTATALVLFLLTGSVLLPLKATVLNLLSLGVMFGALVWVFQDGNFSGVLGFTPTGSIEPSIPLLMFCVTYGLSMDYEVFLVSRITEEHRRTVAKGEIGFWMDPVTGDWLAGGAAKKGGREAPQEQEGLADAENVNRKMPVIPYVQDTRNILVLRLAEPVTSDTAITLQYALERGIEA